MMAVVAVRMVAEAMEALLRVSAVVKRFIARHKPDAYRPLYNSLQQVDSISQCR